MAMSSEEASPHRLSLVRVLVSSPVKCEIASAPRNLKQALVDDTPFPSGIKIFISYGRRDAGEFADRLVSDLGKAGFQVRRDTEALRASGPWDGQIESVLKSAHVVIAVLTPHPVRTGEGTVCLDELAFARFRQPPTPIVPILVLQCDPPFVIYRLQYIDFLGAADPGRYARAFDELARTPKAISTGAPPTFRTPVFESLDFDLYLKAKIRDFVGREWLLDELAGNWMSATAPRPYWWHNRRRAGTAECRKVPIPDLRNRGKIARYSITSSAVRTRARTDGSKLRR
jgi:TIR domain